jgi:hypothetical protein
VVVHGCVRVGTPLGTPWVDREVPDVVHRAKERTIAARVHIIARTRISDESGIHSWTTASAVRFSIQFFLKK